MAIGEDSPDHIVCIDESAVNVLMTFHLNGWSHSTLMTSGIIYSHIKVGTYNGNHFLNYLHGLLDIMNPYPALHSVLVMDNFRIHHVDGVEELCQEQFFFLSIHTQVTITVASNLFIYLHTPLI
ncbi:hypothetical protein M404DRAFT_150973 [Pisolithus tinctorius Marx 270]|uniref:Tc1-like transposase DDE domain-containing protein n=1 Tax=Pisolithus tinctorius Marx 270 TaxID=870435 RepID=A0A0C3IWE9_PISTI|nr:hypothetical protein M404DRAFT_150973 [Pisolithus tinctorius Marx 270]